MPSGLRNYQSTCKIFPFEREKNTSLLTNCIHDGLLLTWNHRKRRSKQSKWARFANFHASKSNLSFFCLIQECPKSTWFFSVSGWSNLAGVFFQTFFPHFLKPTGTIKCITTTLQWLTAKHQEFFKHSVLICFTRKFHSSMPLMELKINKDLFCW